ncbi:hypothetical protein Brsp01_07810 [Brucella sp. NBRC 12950]|nr:hypothetical protein Brsp01_07810 [Brucella sp. NBRC 12950]
MTNGRTDDPPTGEVIEFTTDGGITITGSLHFNGTRMGVYSKGHRPEELPKQYTSEFTQGFFEVRRWRSSSAA